MYEEYFGLQRPPFKITPDTSLFYDGGKRGDILAALVYAIHRGEGIIKVVGEVGSGKTMLCRMMQLKLPDTVEIVYIANPSVSAEDILFVIAHELSLPVGKDASKHEVMHLLQDYLLQRHMENKQVVLFVEEAQVMPLDTLEEIRLLSNLETDENKLLQIILFGQPELDQNLAQQSIRQLRERITHNFNLEPLTRDEIHNYLNFRMREVGYTGPELVNSAVARKIEVHSEGLLRRINIIADKILLSAFAEGTHNLSAKHVTAAVNDSSFGQETGAEKSRLLWWLGGLILVALAFAFFQNRSALWAALGPEMTSQQEIVVINDKPVTEILALPVETEISEPVELTSSEPASTEVAGAGLQNTTETIDQTQTMLATTTQPIEQAAVPESGPESGSVKASDTTLMAPVGQAASVANTASETAVAESAQGIENAVLKSALDQASSNEALAAIATDELSLTADYNQWLNAKLRESRDWLSNADRNSVSIQVLMRSKSAARELVYYLRHEWPLDLSETYLYEVSTEKRSIYRVFYSEFETYTHGKNQLELLPESVKVNSPYLHSVYRMQKALL